MGGGGMRRPFTILAVLLVGAVSVGVYEIEARVRQVARELAIANAELIRERQAIRVLRAEWSYFSQPSRLQALAAQELPLQPLVNAQYGNIADLPMRPPQSTAEAAGDQGDGAGPVMRNGVPLPAWKPRRHTGMQLARQEVDNG